MALTMSRHWPLALAFSLIAAGGWLLAAPTARQATAARVVAQATAPEETRRRSLPIERVRLGDRVHVDRPNAAAIVGKAEAGLRAASSPSLDGEEVVPAGWRRIELSVAGRAGSVVEVALLRPTWWLEEHGVATGGTVDLSMPEMGAQGLARVESVGPCPAITPGAGRVVTGTFRREAEAVLELRVEGLAEPIGTTAEHPFYSSDRGRFVAAGSLHAGERLYQPGSGLARVGSLKLRPGPALVYNLEVHGDHVYFVSAAQVLVHNFYPDDPGGAPNTPVRRGTGSTPSSSTPNSIYEQLTPDRQLKRRAYYDQDGKQFSREDYIQTRPHKVDIDGTRYNLRNSPHEHSSRTLTAPDGTTYQKWQVRILDQDGRPITGWVNSGPP